MFTNRSLRAVLALVVSFVLAACSGGGGGGGGGTTPPPGAVIASASEFWVADASSVWTLDGRDTTAGTPAVQYRNRATIGTPMVIGSRTLVAFSSARPLNDVGYVQYRSYDAGEGIRSWLEVVPTTVVQSFIELPGQVRQGSYRAYDFSEPFPGGGTMSITIDVNVVGFVPLSLPGVASAGQALKVVQTYTATFTGFGQTASAASTLTLWYMRGLGVVKQEFVDPNFVAPNNVITEELAGAITPTLRTGVVGDADLLAGLAPVSSTLNIGHPGVASDGSGYLVAARSIDASFYAHIWAAYVDAQGEVVWSQKVIDDLGLGDRFDEHGPVAVSWDGQNFWVVALNDRPTGASTIGLVRQRVSPAGSLLDGPSGVPLVNGVWPALTSDGSNVLAVYGRNLGSPNFDYALYGTLYARDGTVVAAEQQLAALGSGSSGFASAAFSGGRYLVGLESGLLDRNLSMLRLDTTGQLLDPVPLALSTAAQSQGAVALAPWAGNFAAVWVDGRDSASMSLPERAIFGRRIGADGSLLDGDAATGGVALDSSQTSRFGTAAAANVQHGLLAWSAGAYPVSGSPAPGIFGHFLTAGDELAPATGPSPDRIIGRLSSPQATGRLMAPAAATNGSGFLVVWAETESVQSVRGALVFPRLALP